MKVVKIPHPKRQAIAEKPKRKPAFDSKAVEAYAEHLRENPTPSEALFCQLLTGKGVNFEFQAVVCGYIPDFYFPDKKRVIELDGKWHKGKPQKERDAKKDRVYRGAGLKVLRLPSSLIFRDCDRLWMMVDQFLNPVKKAKQPRATPGFCPEPGRMTAFDDFWSATAGL